MNPQDLRTIGVVVGAHGLRGTLKIFPLSDFPERFEALHTALLCKADDPPQSVRITRVRRAQGCILIDLDEVRNREAVLNLVGAELCVREEDSWELPPDVFYLTDLLGFTGIGENGERIGVLRNVIRGAQDILEFEREDGGELLVPFVHRWVGRAKVSERTIEILNWRDLIEPDIIEPDPDSDDD
ncbi:ribosome maturation factor RimM [bacterium]|nr:ribosome maturation factor RimM [bacterium]MBU1982784.1 ribosome maturation factor RimM [bacterium]